MFVVLWTSPDQSLCTRDHVPDVLRHCHHCRPSPRRPSCSPCCPRSSSHAVGVAVCQTPPASPTVTYTTLPPSPHTTTAQAPSRPTSPCSIGDSRTHKRRSRAGSNARPEVSLSREHDAISITVAVAAATLEPPAFVLGEPAHEYHHAPRASHERHAQSHRPRDDCVPLHPGCDAPRHLRAAAEFRCCRGLLDCSSHNPRPVPIVHSRL